MSSREYLAFLLQLQMRGFGLGTGRTEGDIVVDPLPTTKREKANETTIRKTAALGG